MTNMLHTHHMYTCASLDTLWNIIMLHTHHMYNIIVTDGEQIHLSLQRVQLHVKHMYLAKIILVRLKLRR